MESDVETPTRVGTAKKKPRDAGLFVRHAPAATSDQFTVGSIGVIGVEGARGPRAKRLASI
jgi:hypothetical protein